MRRANAALLKRTIRSASLVPPSSPRWCLAPRADLRELQSPTGSPGRAVCGLWDRNYRRPSLMPAAAALSPSLQPQTMTAQWLLIGKRHLPRFRRWKTISPHCAFSRKRHNSNARPRPLPQDSLQLFTNRYTGGVDNYLQVITAQTVLSANQRNDIDLMRRRMDASVLLVKAVGGGWDTSQLPKL